MNNGRACGFGFARQLLHTSGIPFEGGKNASTIVKEARGLGVEEEKTRAATVRIAFILVDERYAHAQELVNGDGQRDADDGLSGAATPELTQTV